ncbi:adenosylcobinamide-GDP ribazoletransferase [Methanopyrus sp.]
MEFLKVFRFLTVLPIGEHPKSPREIGEQAWLGLPAVGLVSGLLAGIVGWAFAGTPVRGCLVALTLLALEGAQHFDGLVDAGDALMAGVVSEESATKAMRDPRVGVGGLVVGSTALLLAVTSFGWVPFEVLVPIEVFSRFTVLPMAAAGEPAPASHSGRVFTEYVDSDQVLLGGLLSVAVSLPFSPVATLTCAVCSAVVAWICLEAAYRTVRGVNGDFLGASIWASRVLSAVCLSSLPW